MYKIYYIHLPNLGILDLVRLYSEMIVVQLLTFTGSSGHFEIMNQYSNAVYIREISVVTFVFQKSNDLFDFGWDLTVCIFLIYGSSANMYE